MRAVALLSGGLDSTTALYDARNNGVEVVRAICASYGQRQDAEEAVAARAIAHDLGIDSVRVSLPTVGTSALTTHAVAMPSGRSREQIAADTSPATYVPARNTILLAVALAHVEVTGADAVIIGANADDRTGYPDCREEYLDAWCDMASLALGRPVTVYAPLLSYTKPEIVRHARNLNVPIDVTWSCYDPQFVALGSLRAPCRVCDACTLRADALARAAHPDPAAR